MCPRVNAVIFRGCNINQTLLASSKWHHRREYVSQHCREEDPGRGMVSKSQGQVSYCPTSVQEESHFKCVHVDACLCRMDQVIVHVGCMSLKESQELVSHTFTVNRNE